MGHAYPAQQALKTDAPAAAPRPEKRRACDLGAVPGMDAAAYTFCGKFPRIDGKSHENHRESDF